MITDGRQREIEDYNTQAMIAYKKKVRERQQMNQSGSPDTNNQNPVSSLGAVPPKTSERPTSAFGMANNLTKTLSSNVENGALDPNFVARFTVGAIGPANSKNPKASLESMLNNCCVLMNRKQVEPLLNSGNTSAGARMVGSW